MTPAWHRLETVCKGRSAPCPCKLQASLALDFSAMLIGGHRGGGPRANMENLDMTKQLKPSDIIAQKMDHIKYFTNDNQYLLVNIARDACYTANNSLEYKRKQLSDALADYDRHMSEQNVNAADRAERYIARLYEELEVLQCRLEIECSVYELFTGEQWSPKPVAKNVLKPSANIDAIRKAVGA
jgi:hypothetical protein